MNRASRKFRQVLCGLGDPEGAAIGPLDLAALEPVGLFRAISYHGIGSVAVRKLKPLAEAMAKPWQDAIAAATEQQFHANAMALELEHRATQLHSIFSGEGISAAIVKGPDFAENLYSHPSDRVFTDIDFLMAIEDGARAAKVMSVSGYAARMPGRNNLSCHTREQKWSDRDNGNILIELHTDLVHDSGLRRRISFGYSDLVSVSDPACARFLVAVIHAAAGHKVHKLQLLVDVLQAFRALDETARSNIESACSSIGARLEISCCLELIAKIFECPPAAQFARRFTMGSAAYLARHLLTEDAVLSAHDDPWQLSRLRRRLFRTLQTLAPHQR